MEVEQKPAVMAQSWVESENLMLPLANDPIIYGQTHQIFIPGEVSRMKRRAVSLAACILCTLLTPWTIQPVQAAHADLAGEISAVLHDKALSHAEEGIEIVRLGESAAASQIIYRHNSDVTLTPASNLKVFTTSAALDRLGPDFKFRTQLIFHDGDLILIGDGDPAFGDAELLSRSGWDVTTVFKNWAELLKKMNVPAVRNVIVDDSIFEPLSYHPHWPADHDQWLRRYEAEVTGFNLNANCVDFFMRPTSSGEMARYIMNPDTRYVSVQNLCVSGNENAVWLSRTRDSNDITLHGQARSNTNVPVSVTIHDAPLFAATVFAETVSAEGIKRTGDVHRDRGIRAQLKQAQAAGDKSWVVLAINETPIAQVMARANKDSMNLYAECLCKRLGAEVSGQSGSWDNGPAAVGAFLKKIGVPDAEFKLDDGCGLSKQNVISASAMVKVLSYDYFSPNSHVFMNTLAVGGVDGTLDDRFRGTDLRGRVFGKSGFVNGVSSLSGYLHARDGQWYVFSILINGIPEKSNSGIKFLQEKIVRAVDNLGR